MVKTCCVKNCDIAPNGNETCFRFPNSRLLKRKWIDAIGLSNKLTATSTVCIKHFQKDDYDIVRGRPRLKAKVIPSVFCESDKNVNSSCMKEDDIIAEEINTDITLKNLQKDKLNSSEGDKEKLETEGRPESHNENGANESNENSTELRREGKRVLRKQRHVKVKEVSEEVENTTSNAEVWTELQNEGQKEEANTGVPIEGSTDVPNDEVQEGSTESQKEGSTESQKEGSTESQECSTKSQKDGSTENKKKNVEVQKSKKTKPNGVISKEKKSEKCYQDSFIESTTKRATTAEDLNKDIEEILVNYQIKQTRPLHADPASDSETPEPAEELPEPPQESDPVFIELAVEGDRAGSPRDCLMVMESVQVELDPSTFLDGEPDDCHETVDLADDDDDNDDNDDIDDNQDQDCNRRPDPISLLTSSDEDEVIIQEPHIDTVEVSDETDEDDVPLVKLVKKPNRKLTDSIWNEYEFYCMDCKFTATTKQEYKAHNAKHSKILQVCEICDYTTASKSQFSRHKRKHKDDKRFKCHLCDYKAKHNMSLIYHLRSHRALSSAKKGFKCDKCGFKSDVKATVLKHVKLCSSNVKKYSCDKCIYETNRPSDLRRHQGRRHRDDKDDKEFVP